MSLFGEGAVVFHTSAVVRILNDAAEDIGSKFQSLVIACPDFHALRNGTCADHCQYLREDLFVYEKCIGSSFLLGT